MAKEGNSDTNGTFAKLGVVAGKAKTTTDGDFTKEVDYAKDCGQFCGRL